MDPKKLFFDRRFENICVYCGATPETRDHVPSKVLLDEPYPTALPVVPCCQKCNNGFSYDEVYIACLIECVINGSANPNLLKRKKIQRILSEKHKLQNTIESCKTQCTTALTWLPDTNKIRNVIMKLARGHAAFELAEPQLNDPEHISIWTHGSVSDEALANFENLPINSLWPEIGSRAFLNACITNNNVTLENGWNIVQKNLYRYAVSYEDTVSIKIVLSEYLFCEVAF